MHFSFSLISLSIDKINSSPPGFTVNQLIKYMLLQINFLLKGDFSGLEIVFLIGRLRRQSLVFTWCHVGRVSSSSSRVPLRMPIYFLLGKRHDYRWRDWKPPVKNYRSSSSEVMVTIKVSFVNFFVGSACSQWLRLVLSSLLRSLGLMIDELSIGEVLLSKDAT